MEPVGMTKPRTTKPMATKAMAKAITTDVSPSRMRASVPGEGEVEGRDALIAGGSKPRGQAQDHTANRRGETKRRSQA
jgi:hypothetical protein